MTLIKALLVDDEIAYTEYLSKLISEIFPQIEIVGIAHNVEDAYLLAVDKLPNLVFLDVNLGYQTGFDFLKKFPKTAFKTIFCTAYEHYSVQAIRYSAFDYLLKPVQVPDLLNAISRFSEEQEIYTSPEQVEFLSNLMQTKVSVPTRIIVSTAQDIFFIEVSDIVYLMAEGSYTQIVTSKNESYLGSRNLIYYEELLTGCPFIRIHRSYVVNVNFIQRIIKNEDTILTKSGDKLPIASRKKELIMQEIKKWM